MESLLHELKPAVILSTVIYALIGAVIFALVWVVFNKLSPFSVEKEIVEEHNTALAIVWAGVIIGLAMIISAAIH